MSRRSLITEDEVYFVASGHGVIEIAGKDYPVTSGSAIYVPALAPHHFHSFTEPLQARVFFVPPHGSVSDSRAR